MTFPKTDYRNFPSGKKPCHAAGCENLARYRVVGLSGQSFSPKSTFRTNSKAQWCREHIAARVELAKEQGAARKVKRDAENKAQWEKHQADCADHELRKFVEGLTFTLPAELIELLEKHEAAK